MTSHIVILRADVMCFSYSMPLKTVCYIVSKKYRELRILTLRYENNDLVKTIWTSLRARNDYIDIFYYIHKYIYNTNYGDTYLYII